MKIITFINTYGAFFQTLIIIVGAIIALRQLRTLNRQIRGNSLQQIEMNDREIKKLRFNNPWLLDAPESLSSDQKERAQIYMNLLVNHAKHIFVQYDIDAIPKEYWDAVDRDMKYSVKHPIFVDACKRIRDYVPFKFKQYLDSIIP